jgi:hypothetical protein
MYLNIKKVRSFLTPQHMALGDKKETAISLSKHQEYLFKQAFSSVYYEKQYKLLV